MFLPAATRAIAPIPITVLVPTPIPNAVLEPVLVPSGTPLPVLVPRLSRRNIHRIVRLAVGRRVLPLVVRVRVWVRRMAVLSLRGVVRRALVLVLVLA
jgi:hypothetical protein